MTKITTIAAVAALSIGSLAFSAPAFAYHHHHHGHAAAAGAFGFAAGTLFGAAIAQPRPQTEVIYVQPANNWASYCMSRYHSYNPSTNLYIGYDGYYHECR